MKKILIVQVYNANKGNASVITAMLDHFDEAWKGNVSISAYDPEKATRDYGTPACDMLLNARGIKLSKGWRKYWSALCELTFILYYPFWFVARRLYIPAPLFGDKRRVVKFYKAADVVVMPDGHSFTSLNGLFANLSHFIALFTGIALRKKTMIYGQTIGPFFGWKGRLEEFVLRRLLPRVGVVTVRDRQSYEAYSKYTDRMRQTAEIVFAMKSRPASKECAAFLDSVKSENKPILSVTIHHLYYKRFFTEEQYVSLMGESLRRVVDKYGLNLLFVPMEDAVHKGGDRGMIEKIAKKSGLAPERIHIPTIELSPEDTAALIASTDFFVGTKTHSVVYGLRGAVPMIGLAYQAKTREFMQMFDDEKYAIDLGDLKTDEFCALFDELVGEKDAVRELLQRQLDEVCRKALENNDHLRELIDA